MLLRRDPGAYPDVLDDQGQPITVNDVSENILSSPYHLENDLGYTYEGDEYFRLTCDDQKVLLTSDNYIGYAYMPTSRKVAVNKKNRDMLFASDGWYDYMNHSYISSPRVAGYFSEEENRVLSTNELELLIKFNSQSYNFKLAPIGFLVA